MFIVKEKGKIFYFNGELFLSSLLWGSENGVLSTGRDLVMYSDTYESKFKKIEKLVKEEKDNPLFKELIPCIEKGLERYGVAPKFKSLSKCINEF